MKKTFVFLLLFIFFCVEGCAEHAEVAKRERDASVFNVDLGLAYLRHGDIDLAKAKLLLALHQSPENSLANDAMGYFLERTGDVSLAEKYYKYAIKVAGPTDMGASFNNYGTYLYRQSRYEEAIKYFLLAANQQNYLHEKEAYENAAHAAEKLGRYNEAKNYYHRAHLLNG
jgi:type IV pilus assembly protein PilF